MSEGGAPDSHMTIWGTDVNVLITKRKFKDFLENFVDDLGNGGESPTDDDMTPYYITRLEEVSHTHTHTHTYTYVSSTYSLIFSLHPSLPQINALEDPFLTINCDHLLRYNQELYSQVVRYPQEVIPNFDLATNELFNKFYPDTVLEHQIQVGVTRGCDLINKDVFLSRSALLT